MIGSGVAGYRQRGNDEKKGGSDMAPDEPRQDPQDKEFGATAARDAEVVDEMDGYGAEQDDLPPHRKDTPRAGGKAPPRGD